MNDELLIDDCLFRFDEASEKSHREGVCTTCMGRIRATIADGITWWPASGGARAFAAGSLKG